MVVSVSDGRLVHSEMRFGDGYIIVDSEWADHVASPASVAGKNMQSVYVRLKDGLDSHCDRARAAGAEIVQEPADQFYGERQYRRAILKVTSGHFPRPYARFHARRLSGWAICRS